MKKTAVLLIGIFILSFFAGCGNVKGGDYPPAIMVNGIVCFSSGNALAIEVDESVIQYTNSYSGNALPQKDGEANFNRDEEKPYAVLDDGRVVVLMDDEWIEFKER